MVDGARTHDLTIEQPAARLITVTRSREIHLAKQNVLACCYIMLFTTIWRMYNGENRLIYVMNMFYMIFLLHLHVPVYYKPDIGSLKSNHSSKNRQLAKLKMDFRSKYKKKH